MSDEFNFGDLSKQAELMKAKLQEAYNSLEKATVTGKSDNPEAPLEITMTGRHYAIANVSPDFLRHVLKIPMDPAKLEEMSVTFSEAVTLAINDAVEKVEAVSREKLNALAEDMQPSNLIDTDE